MINMQIGGVTCRLSLLFPAFLLLLLKWDTTGLVMFGVSAACLHECGHIAMCLFCRKYPVQITLSFFGIRLQYDRQINGSYRQDLLIAAAGPLINLLCAAALHMTGAEDVYVFWHLITAVCNLLPIEPLDGAAILLSALSQLSISMNTVQRLCSIVSQICLCFLILLGMALCMHTRHNVSLLLFALYACTFRLFYKGN